MRTTEEKHQERGKAGSNFAGVGLEGLVRVSVERFHGVSGRKSFRLTGKGEGANRRDLPSPNQYQRQLHALFALSLSL